MAVKPIDFGSGGGGIPLVMGSVLGYRMWTLKYDGSILRSPVMTEVSWSEERKRSRCETRQSPYSRYYRGDRHQMLNCTCGFYAYFGGIRNPYRKQALISGVIEGTGETVIGTKGFRCAEGRVLAIAPNRKLLRKKWFGNPTGDLFVSRFWRYALDVDLELVRLRYPNIQIFKSEREMRRAFPVPTQKEVIR